MDMKNTIVALICGAVMLVGAIGVVYQVYQITLIDAGARGLKHPKLWGVFAMSGNNSGGLIMYLIGRRKYPVINMTDTDRQTIKTRKKAAGVALVFLAVGAIGLVIGIALV